MTKRNIGMLMAIVGSAIGTWWLVTQQRARTARVAASTHDRGTVIFDNTPHPSDTGAVI